jgi:chemotaxis family two-component system response regulator Rcp1
MDNSGWNHNRVLARPSLSQFPIQVKHMKIHSAQNPIEILLVEDSPTDIELTIEALRDAKVFNTLHIVEDGVSALTYLRKEGRYAGAVRPDLIMLDLNLPRKNGREVLAEIKSDADLSLIPVVILTTSQADQDIAESYRLHANCFVTKPVDFEQFVNVIRSIEDFWFTVVKLPKKPDEEL